ncbi:guanylate kinase [Faecalicatena sp. AGMB00832]|uniref:Guanylate kinase n=1 Tax=Faecalicatena faecalis TaxID=2726362 RepID=A0ABS6D530_9FIRM|nr:MULTISPECIES: guanylate kinase [Faecalicatena]MBU3876563.1 guanylate kinase [Faecalicatena faecalis]MCI6464604.1 guanylate kinase [Faecalicatena sp.]MDY5618182.1 guanylate kinase [Lachnospiraceae bacterium]
MGKICYIMGKSSSGKDTIYKRLKERMPQLKTITLYTTRPVRAGETDGVEYYFVDEERLAEMENRGCVIELRAYNTKCGVWKYFTADDGQIDLDRQDYLVIGTLQSYEAMCKYFGEEIMIPVYIEVEDGLRLYRALERERIQDAPKYAEMCRRFLADQDDFSEENLRKAGIKKRFINEDIEVCLSEIQEYLQEKMF